MRDFYRAARIASRSMPKKLKPESVTNFTELSHVGDFHAPKSKDLEEEAAAATMSRREGRDSDSRRHRSRFDREPRYPSRSHLQSVKKDFIFICVISSKKTVPK